MNKEYKTVKDIYEKEIISDEDYYFLEEQAEVVGIEYLGDVNYYGELVMWYDCQLSNGENFDFYMRRSWKD